MAQPTITYSLNWGNNTAQKLSGKTFVNPSGVTVDCASVTVTFSSSVNFQKFYATAVKEGKNYGFHQVIVDPLVYDVLYDIGIGWPTGGSSGTDAYTETPTGVKVYELTNRNGSTNFSFTINVNSHLTAGEGLYRIGLYVQQADGTWNYEYFFVPVGSDYFDVGTSGTHLQVPVISK